MNTTRFFVYGTLCRGECRERCWPVDPLTVVPSWTFGCLFGRADYPAMRPGSDRVRGECWEFSADDAPILFQTLDEIEGTNQPGQPNLYDRVIANVFPVSDLEGTSPVSAHTYHYAKTLPKPTISERQRFLRIVPGPDGFVTWGRLGD